MDPSRKSIMEDPGNFAPERPTRSTRNPKPIYKEEELAGRASAARASLEASRKPQSRRRKLLTESRYSVIWASLFKAVVEKNCGGLDGEMSWQEELVIVLNKIQPASQEQVTMADLNRWLRNKNLAKLLALVQEEDNGPNWRHTLHEVASETELQFEQAVEVPILDTAENDDAAENAGRKRGAASKPELGNAGKKRKVVPASRANQAVAAEDGNGVGKVAVGSVSNANGSRPAPDYQRWRQAKAASPVDEPTQGADCSESEDASDDMGGDSDASTEPETSSDDSDEDDAGASSEEKEQKAVNGGNSSVEKMETEDSDGIQVFDASAVGEKACGETSEPATLPEDKCVSGDEDGSVEPIPSPPPVDESRDQAASVEGSTSDGAAGGESIEKDQETVLPEDRCVSGDEDGSVEPIPSPPPVDESKDQAASVEGLTFDGAAGGESIVEDQETAMDITQSEVINGRDPQIEDVPVSVSQDSGNEEEKIEEDTERIEAEGQDLPSGESNLVVQNEDETTAPADVLKETQNSLVPPNPDEEDNDDTFLDGFPEIQKIMSRLNEPATDSTSQ